MTEPVELGSVLIVIRYEVICMQVREKQLEMDMEQQIGSKLGKEFVKAVFVVQLVKNLPAMWETWVPSLGWVDPLEKGRATHSSILALRIPWTT